jgi:hypothetical protein
VPQAAVHTNSETHIPATGGGESDGHDLIRVTGEGFPAVTDRMNGVGYPMNGPGDVEGSLVSGGDRIGIRHVDQQIGHRQVSGRIGTLQIFFPDGGSEGIITLLDGSTYLRQGGRSIRVIARVAITRPERAIVEGDALMPYAAKNHGAGPSVAEGQGLLPYTRRSGVPEPVGLGIHIRLDKQKATEQKMMKFHIAICY